jgi:uncharacterized protein (TIGR02117 family)
MRWLALLLLMARCAPAPAPYATDIPDGPKLVTIYLVRRGWHTDIALPARPEIGPDLLALARDTPGTRYLVFGFAEKTYSEADDKDFLHMVLALFPGPGILLVSAIGASPREAFGDHVYGFAMSQAQLDRLDGFIWHSLQKSVTGVPISLHAGPYPDSEFYASSGTYDATYTCNTWSAEALGTTGLPINAGFVLFAGQIEDQAKPLAADQVPTPGS